MSRRHLALLAAGLLAAAFPASASATTLVRADGGSQRPQPYQSWIDASYVPTPAGTITLRLGPCPGAPGWATGCAMSASNEIYLSTAARTPDRLLHEIGHFFDARVMTARWRARFSAIVRHRGAWAAAASTDPPSEKFAEAYSMCARHRAQSDWSFGMYGYSPSPAQHRAVCALIRAAARAAS